MLPPRGITASAKYVYRGRAFPGWDSTQRAVCFFHMPGIASLPALQVIHITSMTLSATEVWTRLLDRARLELPEQTFRTWLEPTEPLALEGNTIVVGSPDQFAADWNESKHAGLLSSLAPVALGHPLSFQGAALGIRDVYYVAGRGMLRARLAASIF